jgi:EmrB/QacA subfamily drug resistance transporter
VTVSPISRGAEASAEPGAQQESAPRHVGTLLALCCVAQFMVILDVSIVNVALPAIRSSLGFSAGGLQWIVNAYAIAFAGFLLLGGRVSDLLGQRRTFVFGLMLFALASLAGGLASGRGMLIAARAAQGLGGAVIAPSSLAIITTHIPAGSQRHRAVGLWGAMNGAGGAAGVLLGGIVTQSLSWRWVLLINLPIGLAAAIGARLVIGERGREGGPRRSFDLLGAGTLTGGLVAVVYGIVTSATHGWGSAATWAPVALGVVLLGAFWVIEARVAAVPLIPLRVFGSRPLRTANLAVLLLSAAIFPMWYFASLYLQEVLRLSPIGAGLAFLPMALTIMGCAMQAGTLVARFGAGRVLGCGLLLLAAGMALFGRVAVNGGYVADVLAPGLLASTGIGLSVVPSTIAAVAGVEPRQAGLVSGLVNTSRQVGGALGLAILTAIAASYSEHLVKADYRAPVAALTDGFRLAFLVGAGFAAAGAVVALWRMPAAAPAVSTAALARERPRHDSDRAPAATNRVSAGASGADGQGPGAGPPLRPGVSGTES